MKFKEGDLSKLSETDKAYIAGLIDAKGKYYIDRHSRESVSYPFYEPLLSVPFREEETLVWLRDRVPLGYANQIDPKDYRKGYLWRIYTEEAVTLLELVGDYLKADCLARDIFLEMIKFKRENYVKDVVDVNVMRTLEEYATLINIVNRKELNTNERLREHIESRYNMEAEAYARVRYKYLDVEIAQRFLENKSDM